MYTDPRILVDDIKAIYTLPALYYRLDKAIKDPRTTNHVIADLLNEDAALSALLIDLSNSSLYDFPSTAKTITEAISIIGTKQLRDLVLVICVVKIFSTLPDDVIKLKRFWAHCLGCALVARVIAGINRESNVERFFSAGLLHDIGLLLMFAKMKDKMIDSLAYATENKCSLYEAEKHCIGFTHTQVGGYLLKQWRLPKNLIEAVYYHHNPMSSRIYPSFTSVIYIADIASTAMDLGYGGELFVPDIDKLAWEKTGLNDNEFDQIVPDAYRQFHDIMGVFFE